ncbi:MAG: AmmeMemoRadiSam system protein A [Deltaproteobacteria bacterium]|nr:MAG: AmmeMemoRadiSam system protein A [Deltaproteobacteria bacterium]
MEERDRKALLTTARSAIEARLGLRPEARLEGPTETGLGAFVTLRRRGELRGCRGILHSPVPLRETVAEAAVLSAFDDPRFPPVTRAEWPEIDVEVSVLYGVREVRDPAEIELGVDGVLLEYGGRRGFLLPQVADELGRDRQRFLDALAMKAGLPPGAWKLPQARLLAFPVEHFGEADPT